MNRKDYRLIAAAIASAATMNRRAYDEHSWSANEYNAAQAALTITCNRLALTLAQDNPQFDLAKFAEACGI